MFTDGAVLPADMFEPVYPSVSLDAASYQAEQQRGGLYWRAGDATIPDNVTMLLFEYFTPENTLIVRENIPVVYDGKKGDKGDKGDTGADGTPAPMYLGMFEAVPAARPDGTAIITGDTYLNSTSKTLYKWTGSSWLTLPQTDPGWWAAMGDAIKHAADTGNQVEAANIWVQYLVAGTILAENIMSKQLTLKTGGLIKSENYKAGQQGFCINADGSCNFSTIVIEGNALFKGDIESGPLILNSINPSTPGTVWKYSAGEYTDNLYYNLQSTPSGIYGANILIGAIGLSPAQPASYYSLLREYDDYIWKLMFKDKDLNTITYQYLFQGRVVEQDLTIKIYDGNYPAGSGSQYRPQFPCDLQIGFYNPTGKTFRLLNLPTNEPDVQGAIWVDSGKYLRIKQ